MSIVLTNSEQKLKFGKIVESSLELVMRRGQSKFKTKNHGALSGLPYSVKNNVSTLTLKMKENVDIFMNVIEEATHQGSIIV